MENSISAKWVTIKAACLYSGLSIRLIQDYVKDGIVVSSHVTKPGARRGRTLIELSSFDEFIRNGIGGKAEISLNLKKSDAP
jgi:hypothetical protein